MKKTKQNIPLSQILTEAAWLLNSDKLIAVIYVNTKNGKCKLLSASDSLFSEEDAEELNKRRWQPLGKSKRLDNYIG